MNSIKAVVKYVTAVLFILICIVLVSLAIHHTMNEQYLQISSISIYSNMENLASRRETADIPRNIRDELELFDTNNPDIVIVEIELKGKTAFGICNISTGDSEFCGVYP